MKKKNNNNENIGVDIGLIIAIVLICLGFVLGIDYIDNKQSGGNTSSDTIETESSTASQEMSSEAQSAVETTGTTGNETGSQTDTSDSKYLEKAQKDIEAVRSASQTTENKASASSDDTQTSTSTQAQATQTSAAPAADNNSAVNDEENQFVYVSDNGKYHSSPNCSNIKSSTKMTLKQAKANGYQACKKCWK